MTAKKLALGAALLAGGLLAGTSASLAQVSGYYDRSYGTPAQDYLLGLQYGRGFYDYAPGYGTYNYAPGYGRYGSPYHRRGGPGPRFGNGYGGGVGGEAGNP